MNRPPAPTLRIIVALSAATFAVLGLCLTLPGTLLPLLVEQFEIRLVEAGSMLALQPVGYLLAVIAAGHLINQCGMRGVLCVSMLTSAVGFAGFGMAAGWISGGCMMFITGLGFGVIEVGTNTLLISIGGERRANLLNFAHLFFGIGSFIGPGLSAHAVAAGVSWRIAFLVAGALAASVGGGWGLVQLGVTAPSPAATAAGRPVMLHTRLALSLAVMLGMYVGVEMGIGGWLTKYMVTVRGVALTYAGNALSVYWLGLAAGRLLLSLWSHHAREETLLIVLSVSAAVAAAAALLVATPAHAALCFAATGVGFSGIFPSAIALGGRHHPHDTARVTSVMIAGAGIGGILIPWAMSAIADGIGLTAGMGFYAGICAAMALLTVLLRRALAGPLERSGEEDGNPGTGNGK
jgi:fucose permease